MYALQRIFRVFLVQGQLFGEVLRFLLFQTMTFFSYRTNLQSFKLAHAHRTNTPIGSIYQYESCANCLIPFRMLFRYDLRTTENSGKLVAHRKWKTSSVTAQAFIIIWWTDRSLHVLCNGNSFVCIWLHRLLHTIFLSKNTLHWFI